MTSPRASGVIRVVGVLAVLCMFVLASRREMFESQPPPTYIINLKRRPDRLRTCRAALPSDMRVEVIEAVDGRDLKTTGSTKLTRGEVGCFLSHLTALDVIARGESAWGLVLEDDARLDIKPQDIPSLIREAPRDTDIVSLGSNAFRDPPHTRRVSDRLHEFLDQDMYGTHAMMYSRRGARALLREARARGFDIPYDIWISRQDVAKLAVAHPPLAHVANIKDSETQKTR